MLRNRQIASLSGEVLMSLWILLFGAVVRVNAAPPRVVKTVPVHGDQDVDPNLREIRVEFDQNMKQGSYSWCGGGDLFPKVLGKPGWKGPKVAILRVRLEPDHSYNLSINCPSGRRFVGASGTPAEPYPLSFHTGTGTSNGGKPSESVNAEAVAMLREAILKHYSYRDKTGTDWRRVIGVRAKSLRAAKTPLDFAQQVARMLKRAKDVHLWLEVDGQTIPTYQRNVKPNGDIAKLQEFVPSFTKHNSMVSTGRFEDEVGYILITTWSGNQMALLEPAFAALTDFADLRALIIDVRFNAGGAESLAREFAGCFIDTPKVYAKHVSVAPDLPGGFGEPAERVVQPNRARPKWRGKIAVLTGPYVVSSNEAFLLMMKQVPGCKLVGEASFGSSGNPKPFALPNEVTIYLPSWKAMLRDGGEFEGVGIAPDILVPTTPNDFLKNDPVIEAALKILR